MSSARAAGPTAIIAAPEVLMVKPDVLLTGLAFGESARWHDGRFWFANWGVGEVVAVDSDAGSEVVAQLPASTVPLSIDWLPDGRMLLVSGPDATLLRQEPDGSLVTHADLTGLAEILNEIVVAADGTAYLNGGPRDFSKGSVVIAVAPDGSARQVGRGIQFGNGMALSADGSTLIVAESWGKRLSAFDVRADGSLGERELWADLGEGTPDGICLDAEGAVWYADVPNRNCVRVAEGGAVLDTVELDRGGFACALGGPDGRTLFALAAEFHGFETMAADVAARTGQLLTARVAVPAAGSGSG
jgi:sugar lactone lactonase YvrE